LAIKNVQTENTKLNKSLTGTLLPWSGTYYTLWTNSWDI